ncbi:hypothetical protein FGO68_gene6494 [Halteria grandinella]|uniref:PAS domain-containing protein n=1 Tax=Halteria grandinella TaxID=5974 RepID=A0A8J8T9Q4_HALGN|nr:hypothetical protein FGO68_gene6494 [Halteria grandinella]
MTETLLRNFEAIGSGANSSQKTSWIEKVSIQINELQTIMEIDYLSEQRQGRGLMGGDDDESIQRSDAANWGIQYMKNGKTEDDPLSKKNGSFSSMERFDPEYFIMISELTEHFYEEVEYLANAVSSFWKLIQNDALEVDTAHKESVGLAEVIARVYKVFKEIEDASDGSVGSNRQSDFRVCYTFAQLQRLLLNDITQYDLYIAKMNSQREMQRLLRNNMLSQQSKGPEDTGFALVHGSNKNFGNLILCNQLFRKQMGFSSKELRHSNILDYMPGLIKQWHRGFVNDFNRNGGASNGMLNKTSCLFMRKKTGYVTPTMVNVRFHYSRDHEFTFVLFASFMQEIQIQRTAGTGRHKVDEVLFFLCDDQDGRIIDISESCSKQLGLSMQVLHNSDLETVQTNLTVEDICPTLSFKKLKQLRADSDNSLGLGLAAIEEIVDVDLNIIHSMGSNYKGSKDGVSKSKVQKALCQVFLETYGAEKDKSMNIISLILLDQLAMKQYLSQQRQDRRDRRQLRQDKRDQQNALTGLQAFDDKASATGDVSLVSQSQSMNQESGSSESHSSRTNGTSETSVLKQLYSSTDKTASSSLKLITQLIFLVFILLLVISTINLVLSLSRYEQLQNEVKTVRQSYDRIQINGKTRLLLRGLLNIANGYEPNQSEMTMDRFRMFQDELENQIQKLKIVQDYLDRVNFEYSPKFKALLDSKAINVEYLDPYNQGTFETQTYTYAINLFIQRASGMSNWSMDRFRGKINIMRIEKPPANYTPSDDERSLYFLVQTAQGNLRSIGKQISDFYRTETEEHALSVAKTTQLTIIISIASIVLVVILISPIISRIEQRKYMGLKFFLNVEPAHLILLESQVRDFLNLAFSDASVHTGTTHQENNVFDKHVHKQNKNQFVENDKYNKDRDMQQQSDTSSSNNNGNGEKGDNNDKSESDSFDSFAAGSDSKMSSAQMSFIKQSIDGGYKQSFSGERKELAQIDEDPEIHKGDSSIAESSVIEEALMVAPKVAKAAGLRKNSNDEGEEGSEKDPENEQVDKELEYANARKVIMAAKVVRIGQIIFRQKAKTVSFICLLGLVFSAYFIAGYFFSVKPFQETPDIIKSLDTVFFRDITIENAMGFIRCNQLLNETIPAVEDPSQTGADFFLKWSEEREKDFLDMRKNLPSVFKEIRGYFDDIESEILCKIANKNEVKIQEKTLMCKNVYHGVLTKGLTYTMAIILNHFRNLNLKFDSYLRDMDFLKKSLSENATLSLIEVKHFVMDNVFTDMKNMVTQSTTDYYGSLIRQYTILYSLFVVLMFALFIIYLFLGYNKIKDAMWKTNLTLKIMPLDFIPRHCLPELKAFFKS